MKVLALQGSPKHASSTACLLDAFLEGLRDAGVSDIERIRLIDKDVRPCLGCFHCWHIAGLGCVQKDDAIQIVSRIAASDVVIWNFPLYFYSMPSHMKALLDRTIMLERLDMYQDEEGRMRHEDKGLDSSRNVAIAGCGFPMGDQAIFDPVQQQMALEFKDDFTFIGITEAPLLKDLPGDIASAAAVKKLLANLRAAGKEYAALGSLSDTTIETLKQPMLPLDEYLIAINELANRIEQRSEN